jgi:PKD repeat protein
MFQRRQQSSAPRTAGILVLAMAVAGSASAQSAMDGNDTLNGLSVTNEQLELARAAAPVREAQMFLASPAMMAWEATARSLPGSWSAQLDLRAGVIELAEGGGLAWVPGRGNRMRNVALGLAPGAKPTLATLEQVARGFLPQVARSLGVEGEKLVLNAGRSGNPGDHVWFVDFDVERDGIRIEGARVVFRVNNGNLVQFGTENLPAPGTRTPRFAVSRDEARRVVEEYIGGFWRDDVMVDPGSKRLLPVDVADAGAAQGFRPGAGRSLVAAWQFVWNRPGVTGTWRARVDATTGRLLDFYDINHYAKAQVTGGAFQLDRPAAETVLAMPWANVGTGVYTNSAGVYDYSSGTVTSTLNGRYVRIVDSCGSISKASDASGNITFGTSSGTDCTTPGSGGAGNTHAARTQFYSLNRAKEAARGWLPSNSWLSAQLVANVNLNQTCNAYWNGSSVNFFRSGSGCANTGELPGVALHEYGHGMDSNDGNGSSPDNGTGETYGDFTAALATHQSCIGNGFLANNCSGYGNSCTACTGVRDIDWAKHSRNTPSTVDNFTRTTCPNPSASNPNYKGPCGKEGHCESLVSSEALWDLAARDLPNPGSGAAWAIADRLWYLSRSTATAAFSCSKPSSTQWTSNGCGTGSLWKVFRAVDDDDGNLANGTPHGGALYAAFNRHGIACTTDAGASTTFAGCTPPAVPTLALSAGDSQVTASWSGSTGVYDLYRNETGCNAGFIKVGNDLSGSSTTDTGVANGTRYYYQLVAQPSGNEACASAPSTCQSIVPAAAPCTPPAAPTGVSAAATSTSAASVSWSAVSGATQYRIYRGTTSGGPYTQVGTSATTSYADSGLSCNTSYYYVVRAYSTCESGNSAQAVATTNACNNTLANGVPVTGISGAASSQQFWTMSVPSGATNLTFQSSGGTGDADLYVRFGAAPTTSTYDCRSWASGNTETCSFATPSAGTYHVMLNAYSAFSGAQLVGSYTLATNTPPTASFTFTTSGLTATFTDTSTDAGGSVVGWSWNFGDSTTSTTRNPSKTYAAAGTYTVGLTVTDNGGLTGSTSRSVTVSTTPTCTAVAESESNDTTSSADALVAPCSTVAGTFTTDTNQNDYFRMSVPNGATVTALLNGLTVDYDLYLYRSGSSTAVASSTNGGTTADQASWTNTTGAATTVYVRVYRYSSTRTTYALRVSY